MPRVQSETAAGWGPVAEPNNRQRRDVLFSSAKSVTGLVGENMESWWREVVVAPKDKIDWSECPLVEVKPGVQSGAPVLRVSFQDLGFLRL